MSRSEIAVVGKTMQQQGKGTLGLQTPPPPTLIQSTRVAEREPSLPSVSKVTSPGVRTPPTWDIVQSEPCSPTTPPVKETHRISIDHNAVSGRKQLNCYEVYKEIGRGVHGKVKLGRDMETGEFVAIKTVDRKDRPRLGRPRRSSAEEKVRREIAILKKCQHPNIVRLIEVLDDVSCRKIYLVLEYLEKGEIKWQNADGSPAMSREAAKQAARDTLLGLEYIHSMKIIHRDIKPANLLLSKENVVKISDFGVSYAFTSENADNELEMAKTVGTPAFFAPELCVFEDTPDGKKRMPITAKIDIWAYGVTLFCFVYGHLPFEADNEYELFRIIANQPVQLPDPGKDHDLELANDLLIHLLDRDPQARWDIEQIKQHPWLATGLAKIQMQEFLSHEMAGRHQVDVSQQEVNDAVKGITNKLRLGFAKLATQLRSRSSSGTVTPSSLSSGASSKNSSSRSLSNKKGTPGPNAQRGVSDISTTISRKNSSCPTPSETLLHSSSNPASVAQALRGDTSMSSSQKPQASPDKRSQTLRQPSQAHRTFVRPYISGVESGAGSDSQSSTNSDTDSDAKAATRKSVGAGAQDRLSPWKSPNGKVKSKSLGSSDAPRMKPTLDTRPKTFYALDPYSELSPVTPRAARQIDLIGQSDSSSEDDDDDEDDGELTLVFDRQRPRLS